MIPERTPIRGRLIRHGKIQTYQRHRCRCPDCRRAATEAKRRHRHRVATGTVGRRTKPDTARRRCATCYGISPGPTCAWCAGREEEG